MPKKLFHVRMESVIDALNERIKGMDSSEIAQLAGQVFGYEPSLKIVGDDTVFTFVTHDSDDEDFDILKRHEFEKAAMDRMPAERKNRVQRLFEAAETGTLPADFKDWKVRDPFGRTVAHQAALYGHLPEGFNDWMLVDEDGNSVAHEAARTGQLPADFKDWAYYNDNGLTVAHMAAIHGHLPADFNEWDLLDTPFPLSEEGKTVAQYAAEAGNLPADFDRWDLVSEDYRPRGRKPGAAKTKVGM